MPSSETTQLAKSIVKDLEIKDIRFDLIWAFGDILKDVPRRLGSDTALDSATKTFTTVVSFARSGKRTEDMMKTYVDGLRSMSAALNGRSGSCKGNIWMMVYLMWICQAWFGRPDDFTVGHSQGISDLLAQEEIDDLSKMPEFERKILLSLVMPVLFDSMLDQSIELTAGLRLFVHSFDDTLRWQKVVSSTDDIDLSSCYIWLLHSLIRLPDLLRSRDTNLMEVEQLYRSGKAVLALLHKTLANSETDGAINHHLRVETLRTSCFAAICNLLLNIKLYTSPAQITQSGIASGLEKEQDHLVKLITLVSNKATIYRPLGAIYASMCLVIARPIARDPVDRREIDRLLAEYQQDCQGAKINIMAVQAEGLVRRMYAERT